MDYEMNPDRAGEAIQALAKDKSLQETLQAELNTEGPDEFFNTLLDKLGARDFQKVTLVLREAMERGAKFEALVDGLNEVLRDLAGSVPKAIMTRALAKVARKALGQLSQTDPQHAMFEAAVTQMEAEGAVMPMAPVGQYI